ncbi:diguanylate cyclase (GGDEF)-like protein [Pelomonas saccharophila]|uniref:Diguanylate cyclase (GGDEF)-like protein n=1 Tax=Roseateles saccharophilus TaxID=304 RepID=A0ABU1YK37_ROSSA|nr:response regulator [Roseateles saccharophilus]MDR7269228.1 diguanylate cyclase (GGDEF)-like protein [Roseateles saccharophilus]
MPLAIPSSIRPAAPSPLASRVDSLLPALADARVLLVDDDPGMIQMLGRLLSGYTQLRFAMDGVQALAIAQTWQPELVLLDAEMPVMDGFEVCRRLKADPLLAEVPVIFVTQHTDARVEAVVFELGAADFVAKPVAGPALRARVAMQLRLHRTAQHLVRLSRRDALTGLVERAQFDEELELECRRARRSGQPLALLLASLQGLAAYLERHGRGAADNALRHVAGLAQQALRRPADLVARHGENVFALLLPDTTAAGAAALAQRLQQALASESELGLAIGIGLLAGDGDPALAADAALAAACAGPASVYICAATADGHEPPFAT